MKTYCDLHGQMRRVLDKWPVSEHCLSHYILTSAQVEPWRGGKLAHHVMLLTRSPRSTCFSSRKKCFTLTRWIFVLWKSCESPTREWSEHARQVAIVEFPVCFYYCCKEHFVISGLCLKVGTISKNNTKKNISYNLVVRFGNICSMPRNLMWRQWEDEETPAIPEMRMEWLDPQRPNGFFGMASGSEEEDCTNSHRLRTTAIFEVLSTQVPRTESPTLSL